MGTNLKGKNAIVTGAGRGIGCELAKAFAAEGANVVVNDPGVGRGGEGTDAAPADQVVAEIKKAGGNAIPNFDSVTDFAAAERMVKSCVDTFGSIDILINCAGVLREKMVFNMPEEDWDIVINVHLKGTFNMCRHASGLMRAQKSGRIINLISDAWRGTVGQSNYAAAKGGILSFTYSLARELGKYGVTANCIAPLASTRMTMNDGAIAGFKKRLDSGLITQEYYEELMNTPGPEYVPPAALYLCTDAASNINGQIIGCGGGRIALFNEQKEIRGIYKDHITNGAWTMEEMTRLIPKTLLVGYINPAPPAE